MRPSNQLETAYRAERVLLTSEMRRKREDEDLFQADGSHRHAKGQVWRGRRALPKAAGVDPARFKSRFFKC